MILSAVNSAGLFQAASLQGRGSVNASAAQPLQELETPSESPTAPPLEEAQAAANEAERSPNELTEETRNALQQAASGADQPAGSQELTEEEQQQVEELKQVDQEVRAHEQAHKTVGGPYAGAIRYETTRGPDGREYAIGGEVPIDASAVPNNPEATIRKMDVVVRAALAPAEPSSQDFAVARAAQATRLQAQRDLQEQREVERNENTSDSNPLTQTPLERIQEEQSSEEVPASQQQDQLPNLIQTINQVQNLASPQRGSVLSVSS